MHQIPHFVRPDMQAFLNAMANVDGPNLADMSLKDARNSYLAMHGMADRPARELAIIRDFACFGPAGDIPLRLYNAQSEQSAKRQSGPVIVFYHGGGFVIGDLETHHSLCTEIAALTNFPVVAVDYRLAPEHPFPAPIDDCEAATRWIADASDELGYDVTSLVLMGDSAGGNASVVVAQSLAETPASVPVSLQVPLFPLVSDAIGSASLEQFADGFVLSKETIEYFDTAYQAPRGNPRAFPILGDHSVAPATILVTASLDPIRDSGRDYGAALAMAGVDHMHIEVKGLTHSFTNLRAAVPSAQGELERICTAMNLMLETSA